MKRKIAITLALALIMSVLALPALAAQVSPRTTACPNCGETVYNDHTGYTTRSIASVVSCEYYPAGHEHEIFYTHYTGKCIFCMHVFPTYTARVEVCPYAP